MGLKAWLNKLTSEKTSKIPEVSMNSSNFFDIFPDVDNDKDILSEIVYFACIKLLAETLGKMPIQLIRKTDKEIKKINNDITFLLKIRPNKFTSASIFWSTVERLRSHYGNAYILIYKEKNLYRKGFDYQIEGFYILQNCNVDVVKYKNKLFYRYKDDKDDIVYSSDEILHFKSSITFDGIIGKSTAEILKETLQINRSSQTYTKNLYDNGIVGKSALHFDVDLDENGRNKIKEKLTGYIGAKNAGGFISLPAGVYLKPLDLKLTDTQFLELRKYNSLQIAMAFGIKPDMINDYTKSSYSTSEAQQLSFYIDTMQFALKQYEDELNFKLLTKEQILAGLSLKINEKVVLRTNSAVQSNILVQQVMGGIRTPNEAREKLNLNPVMGGDELMVNGSYKSIQELITQTEEEGEDNK